MKSSSDKLLPELHFSATSLRHPSLLLLQVTGHLACLPNKLPVDTRSHAALEDTGHPECPPLDRVHIYPHTANVHAHPQPCP
jgi:hypothetical protein